MIRNWIAIGAALLSFVVGAAAVSTGSAWAAQAGQASAPAAQAQQKTTYTLAEYNAYQAAHGDTNPQTKIMKLDAFVMQYPMSTLMPYVYLDYYQAYLALKNYAQVINYADKMLALPNLATPDKLQAEFTRAQAYYMGSNADKSLQTPDAATKARDQAKAGLDTLGTLQKPANATDDQFAQTKKTVAVVFNTIVGMTSTTLKDYPAAADAYKALIMLDPNNAIAYFQLGVVQLELTPPDADNAFWNLARSIGLKSPQGPNEQQVRAYLRNQLARYQQAPACDKLVDDEVNNLVMLAGTSADKPATLMIPTAADLDKARNDVANFLPALQMGGDTGKTMWLATCGLEYTDVPVKVMDAPTVDGDTITMQVYRPLATDPTEMQKELDAATMPNMTIKIEGQPDASRVEKDGVVRFTGTLTDYMQNPFMLTFDKAKINDEDIPAAKKAAPARRAPAKKPASE